MNTQLVKESLAIVDMAFLEPEYVSFHLILWINIDAINVSCEEDEKYTLLEAKLLQFAKVYKLININNIY